MESFTTKIKNEIAEEETSMMEDTLILSAFVRNNGVKDKDKLSLIIENSKVVRYIYSLLKRTFEVHIEMNKLSNYKRRSVYSLEIIDNLEEIYKDLMIYDDGIYLNKPASYFVDSDDLKRAYLKGLFLACGSVNDPKTASYHLEFLTSLAYEGEFAMELLRYFGIGSKVIDRDKGYMVYVKESEKISDFLKLLGVNRSVMYFEDIRTMRDHKNLTNRLNNCEQANVDKTISSANKQIMDIDYIKEVSSLDILDDKVLLIANYRINYPDLSLMELSELISKKTGNKISKSCINHRFRKIREIANRLRQNNRD